MQQYKRREPLEIGKDPGLKLYIWQDPHQPREVVSDGEDDEWRAPPGSLLGSDVLARLYHCSDLASAPQGSQLELEIGPGNGPTETRPRYPTAQESRQELDIVPAKASGTLAPRRQYARPALARAHKFGRSQGAIKIAHKPKRVHWRLASLTKDFIWQHSTDHLTKFDPNRPYNMQAVTAEHPFPRSIFYNYKGYHLCMDQHITSALEVPQLPVRLDDRLVALVYEGFSCYERVRLWPSEFERDGMVKLGRIPLGFAAKYEYKVGDIDFDGNVLQPGEEGWYYLWLGGIHCLMGKEGMDAGRFQPRDRGLPRITGFAFKKSHRAEIQAPPGVESER